MGAYADENFGEKELIRIYDKHLAIKEDNKEWAKTALGGIIDKNSLDIDNDIDYISLICALSSLSAQLRSIAQAMIDERFPEIAEDIEEIEKEKKKEEKKEEKKEKKEIKEKEKEKKKKEKEKNEKL